MEKWSFISRLPDKTFFPPKRKAILSYPPSDKAFRHKLRLVPVFLNLLMGVGKSFLQIFLPLRLMHLKLYDVTLSVQYFENASS